MLDLRLEVLVWCVCCAFVCCAFGTSFLLILMEGARNRRLQWKRAHTCPHCRKALEPAFPKETLVFRWLNGHPSQSGRRKQWQSSHRCSVE